MPTKNSSLKPSPPSSRAADKSTRPQLMRVLQRTREELERDLLAFDVEDDTAAMIPMPSTIPVGVRRAITLAVCWRFPEFADELDEWLHAPNDAFAGATPFERLVHGDGVGVLLALGGRGEIACADEGRAKTEARRHLRVVR